MKKSERQKLGEITAMLQACSTNVRPAASTRQLLVREGADIGAGAGAGSQGITKGGQVEIPSETLLNFTLQQDVSIPMDHS